MNQIPSPESICILSLGPIGDAVLTTRLLHAMRGQFPPATLTVIAGPRNREVFESCGSVDEILVIRNNISGLLDAVRLIVGRRWDIYIDPKDHASSTSRLLAALFRYQTGFVHPNNIPAFRSTIILPPADGPHFVDSVLTPLTALGIELPERRGPRLSGQDMGQSTTTRPSERLVRILLNISAGDRKRLWRDSAWHQLSKLLALREGFDVAILSAPADINLAREIVTGTDATVLDTPRLQDMFDAVAGVDLVVTPDTSVVHVASAFNVPTVALFSSDNRNMARFAPLSENSRTIQPGHGEEGLRTIKVEKVLQAIDEVLSEVGTE